MRPTVSFGVSLAFVGICWSADVAKPDKRLRERIERELCPMAADDPHNTIEERRLVEVESMDEAGRLTLLQMAEVKDSDRGCALRFLTKLDERRALPIARRIAADPAEDSELRTWAILLLRNQRDRESVDLLVSLFQSKDDGVRLSAVRGLGEIDSDAARAALRDILARGSYPPNYFAGIVTLIGARHDVQAIPLLIEVGRKADERNRIAVVWALVLIGTHEGREAAKSLFDTIADPGLRVGAAGGMVTRLEDQRRAAHDALEIAEIDGLIAELKAVTAAVPGGS